MSFPLSSQIDDLYSRPSIWRPTRGALMTFGEAINFDSFAKVLSGLLLDGKEKRRFPFPHGDYG
jgi:hypothetical protein